MVQRCSTTPSERVPHPRKEIQECLQPGNVAGDASVQPRARTTTRPRRMDITRVSHVLEPGIPSNKPLPLAIRAQPGTPWHAAPAAHTQPQRSWGVHGTAAARAASQLVVQAAHVLHHLLRAPGAPVHRPVVAQRLQQLPHVRALARLARGCGALRRNGGAPPHLGSWYG